MSEKAGRPSSEQHPAFVRVAKTFEAHRARYDHESGFHAALDAAVTAQGVFKNTSRFEALRKQAFPLASRKEREFQAARTKDASAKGQKGTGLTALNALWEEGKREESLEKDI